MPAYAINVDQLRNLLHQKSQEQLLALLQTIHPYDCIEALRELELDEQLKLVNSIPPKLAGNIIWELFTLSSAEEFKLADKLPTRTLTNVINEMPSDNAVDILHAIKISTVTLILKELPVDKSEVLEEMLRFDDETAGGRMTDEFISMPGSTTIREAIEEVKSHSSHDILSSYQKVYILDKDERLIGCLPIVNLFIHPLDSKIKEVMDKNPSYVYADVDQEEVAKMFTRYDLFALPVVNRGRRILGRITVDDILNVIHDEADEDFYRLVGTDDDEKKTMSSVKIASIRLPWLMSTLIGSFISCSVIKLFHGELTSYIGIIFFIPVITAMSGNIGVQCSTLIVRGIATGYVNLSTLGTLFFKEFKVGFLIGTSCALLACLGSFLLEGTLLLGLTVGFAMLICIIFASISGTAVPILLKKLGKDPAISSGPIITTFNDLTSLLIYFTIATTILN